MNYAHQIAGTLIQRGLALRPSVPGTKYPGKGSADVHAARRLDVTDLRQLDQQDRFNVIIGNKQHPNLSGIIDVETDGPEGEENLRQHVGELPDGPQMVTRSGSIHRLMVWMPPPEGLRMKINVKGLFGKSTKVDVPWQFLAVDGDRRYWRGLNLPFPIPPQSLLDHLWTPERNLKVFKSEGAARSVNGSERPTAPGWIPGRMRRALDEPAPEHGRHRRTHRLVEVGWVHAGMSSDAILAVIANDPTCWDWATRQRTTDHEAMERLRIDVDGRLEYFHWSAAEDRYRRFVETGQERGELTSGEAQSLLNRRGLTEAKLRASEHRLLCGKAHPGERRAGRPVEPLVFFDPATKVCPYGHRKGLFS